MHMQILSLKNEYNLDKYPSLQHEMSVHGGSEKTDLMIECRTSINFHGTLSRVSDVIDTKLSKGLQPDP